MLCRKPFILADAAYGCGQCLPCLVKRRRIWVHRLMLEASTHAESSFVTVTYADRHLPLVCGVPTLRREDYRLWLKRLRERMNTVHAGWKLRFFVVGEYGSEENRPHYHAALFGYRGCEYQDSRWGPDGERRACRCASCIIIQTSWGRGRVHQGCLERKSAQYLAGYTVKGMTRKDDERLRGREPEFARMSLRPGIGTGAVPAIAEACDRYGLALGRDAPAAIRHGKRILPLGRYLRGKAREVLGVSDEAKARTLEEWREELRALRQAAAALSDRSVYVEGTYDQEIFRRLLIEQDMEKVRQLEGRRKLFERGKR